MSVFNTNARPPKLSYAQGIIERWRLLNEAMDTSSYQTTLHFSWSMHRSIHGWNDSLAQPGILSYPCVTSCIIGESMEYISEIFSFIVGALAGGLTVKIHSIRKTNDSINLKNIKAGGDVAGRDIRK